MCTVFHHSFAKSTLIRSIKTNVEHSVVTSLETFVNNRRNALLRFRIEDIKERAGASDTSKSKKMNTTWTAGEQCWNEIQFGNIGAALFIISYIGGYGVAIIFVFGQQLKETQRQRGDLPAYFLKTLWDVPSKNKLYEELADVERLKRIFRGYFADHETYSTIRNDELQILVEERAYACALKYREKLRRLHISHTDYYLDTIPRLSESGNDVQEQLIKSMTVTDTMIVHTEDESESGFLSISVV